ncbi:MAG: tetratricopeptide repeat protein [Acidobacteria bacterium]|nr:tetratricopeptide repeat protein [Acidobacteriota bacterium]MBI3657712.1 tetratricopeptide repeat protein [Acidobacteriota bacterium]
MRSTPRVAWLSRILIPLVLLLTQCQERPFEERLIYFLHAQQRAELDRLMRQHPGKVRDLLKERLNTWTDLEKTGASAQAQAVLQDTRDLAKEFDRVAQDGFWKRVELRAAQPLSQRLAIRIVDAWVTKAAQAMDQRQNMEALDALDQAERANQGPADPYMQAAIHHHRGLIAQNLYRYKEAQSQFERVQTIHTRIGNRVGLAAVQLDIGLLKKQMGRLSDALQIYREALEEQQRILSLGDAAQTLNNLGNLCIQIGDLRQGMAYLRKAVEQAEKISDDSRYSLALNNLGFAHSMQHE